MALDGSSGVASVSVSNCTFNANSGSISGGGIALSQTGGGTTSLHIGNTILKTGAAGANFAVAGGLVSSNGYNLSSDAAGGNVATTPGGFLDSTGDVRNTDPGLDPAGLKSNGVLLRRSRCYPTAPRLTRENAPLLEQATMINGVSPGRLTIPLPRRHRVANPATLERTEADVRVISETRAGSDLIMTFTTFLGHTYEIQSRPDLLPATPWSTVPGSIPAPPDLRDWRRYSGDGA